MTISGIYNLIQQDNSFFCDDVGHFEDDLYEVYVVDTTDSNFAEKLVKQYRESGTSCVNHLDDLFLAAVYEKETRNLLIFSDATSSPLTLYYTENNGQLFYSTSLKWLLSSSSIKRTMNIRAAKAFLANGYVYGTETLIENVYKLDFMSEIRVSGGSYTQKRYEYNPITVPEMKAKETLISEIRNSIYRNLDTNETVYMPLSGGYDSNLILDAIKRSSGKKIEAFTIGGKTGKSEIDAVKKNIEFVSDVNLHTALVDDSYYELLADIVWRLEGAVYETGVFLQYALARLASETGAKRLICGESSDEIQNKYYYESLDRVISGSSKENEKFFVYADPFIGTNMVVLKKSAIMLNSFGVHGCYPFKSKKVVETAAGLARLNGTNKKYYKKQCAKEFDPHVIENIKTTGGTTNTSAAIPLEKQTHLREILSKNNLINWVDAYDYPIYVDTRTKKLRRRQGLERAWDEIQSKGIIKGLKAVKKSASGSSALTVKRAYLVLFDQLFLSGKYDDKFICSGIETKTSDIIEKMD